MSEFIWNPPSELVEQANVTRLMRRLGAADYGELHRISVEEPDRFWPVVVHDLGIEFSRPWDAVVDLTQGPEWATWFVGGRLNLARICLHRFAGDREALVGLYEDGSRESLTWAEASHRVTQLAEALVELGVQEGDRVALYMPMCPAVAIASHACAHIGAVQVPIFSGFAAPAVASRLEDSQAKVVICADWSLRRGKRIEMRATLDEAGPHAVEHVIAWNREAREWPELVTRQPATLPPAEVDSEAPYLLAYTSGTTGKPKGALLVQGGFLVSIAREVAYQTDVKSGDRIHFATDMGWIMGPWTLVGGGAAGATIVFAEGAPDWPDDRLWRLVESEQVTMLGLSPTLVRALIPKGEPQVDLSSLKALCTTGEPWNPDPYRWLFEHVGGSRTPIVNISGGTEVGACFLTTVITEPIKPVAVGFPALGQDL
ncbi:MAG: acetyl-CoA synthetase, partial [Gaiellaceae bacterium]|nr:acetyl-CoA synthetase [Gaiellaceae bacterium]